MIALMRDERCTCDAPPGARPADHRTACLVFRDWEALVRSMSVAARQAMEDRAAGRKRWRGAAAALVWYARTRAAWCAPKALPLEVDSGAPSRGAENPAHRRFAAVAGAITAAEQDDRERHPAKPAPLMRWLLEHFGAGRSLMWIAENAEDWREVEVEERVRRMCRVVRDHLRDGGWLE